MVYEKEQDNILKKETGMSWFAGRLDGAPLTQKDHAMVAGCKHRPMSQRGYGFASKA